MTEVIETQIFTGQGALIALNDFLVTMIKEKIISTIPVYDVGTGFTNYFVSYLIEV